MFTMTSTDVTSNASDVFLHSTALSTITSSDDITMMTSPSLDSDDMEAADFLHQQNMKMVSLLTPYLVFLVLLVVCGLAGNSTVFVVYYYRFKPSNPRTFILAMSVCDLFTNIFSLIYEVLRVRFSFTFDVWACKVFAVVMSIAVNFSAFVLAAVALERKKMVCGNQVRSQSVDKFVRIALFVCSFIAVTLALPRSVLFGRSTVAFPGTDITGVKCDIQDVYVHSLFRVIYTGLLALLFLVTVAFMAVCYGRIGVHLMIHKKKVNKPKKKPEASTSSDVPSRQGTTNTSEMESNLSVDQKEVGLGRDPEVIHVVPICHQTLLIPPSVSYQPDIQQQERAPEVSGKTSTENVEAAQPIESTEMLLTSTSTAGALKAPSAMVSMEIFQASSEDTNKSTTTFPVTCKQAVEPGPSTSSPVKRSGGLGTQIPSRTTLMLFVFTVFFVLNFLPYLTVQSMRSLAQESRLQAMDINLMVMCYRSFYLNSAINPFVYGFCSARFRYECRQMARRLQQRLWR